MKAKRKYREPIFLTFLLFHILSSGTSRSRSTMLRNYDETFIQLNIYIYISFNIYLFYTMIIWKNFILHIFEISTIDSGEQYTSLGVCFSSRYLRDVTITNSYVISIFLIIFLRELSSTVCISFRILVQLESNRCLDQTFPTRDARVSTSTAIKRYFI